MIIRRPLQGLRQVLLSDPGAVKIVGILIVYAVAQLGRSAVMTIPQIIGNIPAVFAAHITEGGVDGQLGTVALGRTGDIDDGFR